MAKATVLVSLPRNGLWDEKHDMLNVQLIQQLLSSLCVTRFQGCTIAQVSDGVMYAYTAYAVDFASLDTLRTAQRLAKSLEAAFPTLEGVGYLESNLEYSYMPTCGRLGEFDETFKRVTEDASYAFAIHLDEQALYYVPVQS